jgi:hypothetical protein
VSDARCICDECGREIELVDSIGVVGEGREEILDSADFCSWICVAAFAQKQTIRSEDHQERR